VTQRSLGGHAIPLDAPTLRCARRLGLIAAQDDLEAARSSLEHLVAKSKGHLFTDAISNLAEEHCWESEPNCPNCPLHADCPTGLEQANLAAPRGHRPKPR
jgi:endonuclease-3